VLVLLIAALFLALPSSALAWGSGTAKSPGFGSHQWMLGNGNRLAVSQGITWLDMSVATSAAISADSIKGDQTNHHYDRWGKHYGRADTRVRALYAQAVVAYRAGNRSEASRLTGLLSHYYADICNPLHTDDSKAEIKIHSRFEHAVDWLMRRPTGYGSWVHYNGYSRVTDAGAYTAATAKTTHLAYTSLVDHYVHHGFDRTAVKIAQQSANRASNGIANIIMSIQQDAVETTSSPSIMAHQGVAAGPDAFYVFHTTSITRFDRAWNETSSTIDPMGGIAGFTQPHLGDGCYSDGKLYVVAENYPEISNQMILVFDATTLERLAIIPTGQTHEVASVTAVPGEGEHGVLYVASFLDSARLFKYDMDDGSYIGDFPLSPAPKAGIQGVAYDGTKLFAAAGRTYGLGYIYSVAMDGTTSLAYTRVSAGSHEGIEFDGGRLLWLIDRGASGARVRSLALPAF
jgi:hypothetical protein